VAFGAGGEGSIRLCYALETEILEDALARIGEFVESTFSISAS
jgi:aspartate/methionine/tyrosine aminotransferase